MQKRYYTFSLVTYCDESLFLPILKANSKSFAYIYHDKDLKDDGSLKEPHFHIVVSFQSNRSPHSVRELFPDKPNTFVEVAFDKSACFRYLTHSDDPDKFQYPIQAVKGVNFSSFSVSGDASDISQFLDDLSPFSVLTLRELAIKYGRDFIKNYRTYRSYAKAVYEEEFFIRLGEAPNMEHISPELFFAQLDDATLPKNQISFENLLKK